MVGKYDNNNKTESSYLLIENDRIIPTYETQLDNDDFYKEDKRVNNNMS